MAERPLHPDDAQRRFAEARRNQSSCHDWTLFILILGVLGVLLIFDNRRIHGCLSFLLLLILSGVAIPCWIFFRDGEKEATADLAALEAGRDLKSGRCAHGVPDGDEKNAPLCPACRALTEAAEVNRLKVLEEKARKLRHLEEERAEAAKQALELELRRTGILKFLQGVSPIQFEHFVAEMFRCEGFAARVTKGSGDDGIDIFLERENVREIVQCKRWGQGRIGTPVLRDLLGALAHSRAHRGHLVTTGTLSAAARKMEAASRLNVVEGRELVLWVERTFPGEKLLDVLTEIRKRVS